jgi:hypothetical protein
MSYNTQFNVKYNDIEKELIHKLKNKTPEEYEENPDEENPDEEHEYSSEDVLDICNKLYRDELLSVFSAKDITDDTFDKGINYVYDIMFKNNSIKQIIDEMMNFTSNEFDKNKTFSDEQHESLKKLMLISLFSQHIFYITHKCVCQQIEVGTIDDELLVELRNHSVDLLENQFRA